MPIRTIPFADGEIYHIFNLGVNKQPIFENRHDYKRALGVLEYYRFADLPFKFSRYSQFSIEDKKNIWQNLQAKGQLSVIILAFCLMPNHFHLLIRQEVDGGISKFLANFQNSYTKYFNTRQQRTGHLFQGQFKAVRIEDDEQLMHVSRYIHLNPYTSFVVKTVEDLETYPWSSLSEYLNYKEGFCDKGLVLSCFSSDKKYHSFVLDQKDYQRKLDQIKHLVKE